MDKKDATAYVTEDGVTVKEGDLVYNYYDMRLGTIGRSCGDGWFDFHQESRDSGGATMLNGQRICSLRGAERRGWIEDADLETAKAEWDIES